MILLLMLIWHLSQSVTINIKLNIGPINLTIVLVSSLYANIVICLLQNFHPQICCDMANYYHTDFEIDQISNVSSGQLFWLLWL